MAYNERVSRFAQAAARLPQYSGWSPDEIAGNISEVVRSNDPSRMQRMSQAVSSLEEFAGWVPEEIRTNLQSIFADQTPSQQPAFSESSFNDWYAGAAKQFDLDPNPDNPEHYYDYRAAFQAGSWPDQSGHWPSEFKTDGHPRMIIDGVNTKTGVPLNQKNTGLSTTIGEGTTGIRQAVQPAQVNPDPDKIFSGEDPEGLDLRGPSGSMVGTMTTPFKQTASDIAASVGSSIEASTNPFGGSKDVRSVNDKGLVQSGNLTDQIMARGEKVERFYELLDKKAQTDPEFTEDKYNEERAKLTPDDIKAHDFFLKHSKTKAAASTRADKWYKGSKQIENTISTADQARIQKAQETTSDVKAMAEKITTGNIGELASDLALSIYSQTPNLLLSLLPAGNVVREHGSFVNELRGLGIEDPELIQKWAVTNAIPSGLVEQVSSMILTAPLKKAIATFGGKNIEQQIVRATSKKLTATSITKGLAKYFLGSVPEGFEEVIQGDIAHAAKIAALTEYAEKLNNSGKTEELESVIKTLEDIAVRTWGDRGKEFIGGLVVGLGISGFGRVSSFTADKNVQHKAAQGLDSIKKLFYSDTFKNLSEEDKQLVYDWIDHRANPQRTPQDVELPGYLSEALGDDLNKAAKILREGGVDTQEFSLLNPFRKKGEKESAEKPLAPKQTGVAKETKTSSPPLLETAATPKTAPVEFGKETKVPESPKKTDVTPEAFYNMEETQRDEVFKTLSAEDQEMMLSWEPEKVHEGDRLEKIRQRVQEVERPAAEKKEIANVELEPSAAQKEAGNYTKAHIRREGLEISIENPAGSQRSGVDRTGKQWSQTLNHDYGYIRGSVGKDKDHVDVFLKPGSEEGGSVFIVNQVDPSTGKLDEHKVMMGFGTEAEAEKAYLSNYEKGWKGLKSIVEMDMPSFKKWVFSEGTKKEATPILSSPISSYKPVDAKSQDIYNKYKNKAAAAPKDLISSFNEVLAGITDKKTQDRLSRKLRDNLLGDHGVVKFDDVEEAVNVLKERKTPFVYEVTDGGNLGGLNDHRGNHADANTDIQKIWGEIYAEGVRAFGGIISRDQGDEFAVVWPGYTQSEVKEIRGDIERQIRAKVKSLGLDKIHHPKNGLPTGALHTAYGFAEGTMPHGQMVRLADDNMEQMKDNDYLDLARKLGYTYNEETKRYEPGKNTAADRSGPQDVTRGSSQGADSQGSEKFLQGVPGRESDSGRRTTPAADPGRTSPEGRKGSDRGRAGDSGPRVRKPRPPAKPRDFATPERNFPQSAYDTAYNQTKFLHTVNTDLWNALRFGWTDRNHKQHPGKQPGWLNDYNLLTEARNLTGNTRRAQGKRISLSDNAASYLQDMVENLREHPDHHEALIKLDLDIPDHIDGLRVWLEDSLNKKDFVRYHEEYENSYGRESEKKTGPDGYDAAEKQFLEDRSKLTPEQTVLLEEAWEASIDDVVKRMEEETPSEEEMPSFAKRKEIKDTTGDLFEGTAHADSRSDNQKLFEFLSRAKKEKLQAKDKGTADLPLFSKEDQDRAEQLVLFAKRGDNQDQMDLFLSSQTSLFDMPMFDGTPQEAQAAQLSMFGNDVEAAQQSLLGDLTGEDISEVSTPEKETTVQKKGAVGIDDFGEKIGGARKDRWAGRGLTVSDISEMTDREMDKFVTKDQVWPKPDYEKLVEDGTPRIQAFLIKAMRDALPLKPASRNLTVDDYTTFITLTGEIRDSVLAATTPEEIIKVFPSVFEKYIDGRRFTTEGNRITGLFGRLSIRKMQISKWDVSRAERKLKDASWPAKEGIPRGYSIRYLGEAAGFYALHGNRSIARGLPSKEAAIEFINNYVKENATKTNRVVVPQLLSIERQGPDYRKGRDVTGDEVLKVFGFRGGEFGNWVNQSERQSYLNYAYDGLRDLARVLNVPPRALSLNGELGIAFGARGVGKAKAHYEPVYVVINLTKMSGAGSLAHEWVHAMDDYFSRQGGNKTSPFGIMNKLSYKSEGVRPEVIKSLSDLDDTIRFSAEGGRSQFFKDAYKLDQYENRKKPYWSATEELLARAFSAYVEDRIALDGKSDYLVFGTFEDLWIEHSPFPKGEEREKINNAFDKLFKVLKTRETDKGVALFKERPTNDTSLQGRRDGQPAGTEESTTAKAVRSGIEKIGKALPSGSIVVADKIVARDKAPIAGIIKEVTGKNIIWLNVNHGAVTESIGYSFDGVSFPRSSNPLLKDNLFIATDSTRPLLWTAGHEFWHFVETERPDLKKQLLSAMKLTDEGRTEIANVGSGEFAADVVGEFFTDSAFWEELSHGPKNVFDTIIRKVMEILTKIAKVLKAYITGKAVGSRARMEAEKNLRNIDGVRAELARVIGEYKKGDLSPERAGKLSAAFQGLGEAVFQKRGEGDQIHTEAFKKWFGDWEADPKSASKVVDAEGKPLVVYHGMPKAKREVFDGTFKTGHEYQHVKGAYFTKSAEEAGKYTKTAGEKTGTIIPVFLNIKNPATRENLSMLGYKLNGEQIKDALKKQGFDGLIDDYMNEIVVFSPTQIKSATGNSGAFSLENPDIRFAKRRAPSMQQSQTDTEAFKKWFGESKVVDNDGKPLVVYHGTAKGFSEFKQARSGGEFGAGFYFTEDPISAGVYAGYKGGEDQIKPVYLSLKNPYIFRMWDPNKTNSDKFIPSRSTLKKRGHDGVVGYTLNDSKEIIVFSPTQIKSATGNSGEFSPDNPDIRFARRKADPLERKKDESFYDWIDRTDTPRGKEDHRRLEASESVRQKEYTLTDLEKEIQKQEKKLQNMSKDNAEKRAAIELQLRKYQAEEHDIVMNAIYDYARKLGLKAVSYNKVDMLLKNMRTLKGLRAAIEALDQVWKEKIHSDEVENLLRVVEKEYVRLNAIKGKRVSTMDLEANRRLKNYLDELRDDPNDKSKARLNAVVEYYQTYAGKDIKENLDFELPEKYRDEMIAWLEDPSKPFPQSIQKDIQKVFMQNIQEMSTEQIRGVLKDIRDIKEKGRTRREEELERRTAERERNIADIVARMGIEEDQRPQALKNAEDRNRNRLLDNIKKFGEATLFENLRPERIIEWYDGFKSSKMTEVFFEPILNAENKKLENVEKSLARFQEIHSELDFTGIMSQPLMSIWLISPNEVSTTATEELEISIDHGMFIYANSQNPGNLAHLQGTGYDDKTIASIVDALPQEYKDAVDSMIDYFDLEQYPRMNEVFAREHQVDMPKEHRYFPIRNLKSDRAAEAAVIADVLMRFGSRRAAVKKGMTKSRVKSKAPFGRESYLETVVQGIMDSEHYLAFNDAVREVNRYITNPTLKNAMQGKSKEAYKVLTDWLKSVANGKLAPAENTLDKAASWIRSNYTISVLGGNLVTIMKQPASFSQGLHHIKDKRYAAQSAIRFMAESMKLVATTNPLKLGSAKSEMVKFVESKSVMMRNRSSSIEREFAEALEKSRIKRVLNTQGKWEKVKAFMMSGIQAADMATTMTLWHARYQEILNNTMNEELAVRAADALIRRTQPMGGLIHLPKSFRSSALLRAFSMFMNQPNQNFNLIFETATQWQDNPTSENAQRILWYVIAPSIILYMASNGGQVPWDDPEGWMEYLADIMIGGITYYNFIAKRLVRGGTNEIRKLRGKRPEKSFNGFTNPVLDQISELGDLLEKENRIKNLLSSGGRLAGIPGWAQGQRVARGVKEAIRTKDPRHIIWSKSALEEKTVRAAMVKRALSNKAEDRKMYGEWYRKQNEKQKKEFQELLFKESKSRAEKRRAK